jgi:hypothetical protein
MRLYYFILLDLFAQLNLDQMILALLSIESKIGMLGIVALHRSVFGNTLNSKKKKSAEFLKLFISSYRICGAGTVNRVFS